MYVEWTKQAYGFHQATYPRINYNLSANLVEEQIINGRPEQEHITYLGSVTVEEDADGSLTFLFGSQLSFWSGIHDILKKTELYPEQTENIIAALVKKIPVPSQTKI
jgi:hypothetical protein